MSDPKRATLITVGATKSEKKIVNKTVRLNINLVESNESKYPELNYKELVIAEERKKERSKVENGKTEGLNPFSDNDDDVERVARKFEQKYGGKSTYGRKGRSKHDDFADIGAGYDENDSFIDNTDGYDEMIPPECDTFYGGFYINSGSLEFKNVEHPSYEDEPRGRRNKRRISSSSSEEDSSESSSESESQDEKDAAKTIANGAVDSHKTEHRKKKNKTVDMKKAKKIRRTDSSAATSGKQTSDDNAHGDGESDSRTSQSDSLTSKPNPSSENAITSDSSRDVEAKSEVKLPPLVATILDELEAMVSRQMADKPNATHKEIEARAEPLVVRLEQILTKCSAEQRVRRVSWTRAARTLNVSRAKLLHKVKALAATDNRNDHPPTTSQPPANSTPAAAQPVSKHKIDDGLGDFDPARLTDAEREAKIVDTLHRLKVLIEERKPDMMANYNAECERVQEERKKIQIASAAEGAPVVEKRLPKRRFPWCPRSRALLATLVRLAGNQDAAALLLAVRALPLFPTGFVRMPTLLRQADLSKEIKVTDVKRQRLNSTSQPAAAPTSVIQPPQNFPEPIHFPSSLTVTTMKNTLDKTELSTVTDEKDKHKSTSIFGNIINTFSLSRDLVVVEKDDRNKEVIEKKEEMYIPPNNIGSITITPVPSSLPKIDKKVNNTSDKQQKEGLIRIKSPAALNEMIHKQEKVKALENIHKRDKDKHKDRKEKNHNNSVKEKLDTPLHIDTSYQPKPKEPTPSPKTKEEITQKQIENMRVVENNIPRPGLVPVHHSPTFAKPDKRPPDLKKKKDLVIVSDVDPLGDIQTEPLSVDDSSSDVEVVEEKSDKSDSVPSKDKVSVREVNHKKDSKDNKRDNEKRSDKMDEATKEDFDSVMKNLRDLEHSQEAPKFNSSYGGVITSAKREKSTSQSYNSRSTIFGDSRSDKDKLTNFFEQNGWM
ncbi:ubinuclein-2 isoform X2 [Pectinophora gossypiella]|uniref:ubinuclein-2 isoform X2 n=1 Tax=Pectinophora gossypiella TaxID=13191 RepID=UPI00214E06E5|nr:ubinuclein-2 isoform X2 [Pectinophora gossypiella]